MTQISITSEDFPNYINFSLPPETSIDGLAMPPPPKEKKTYSGLAG